MQSVASTIADPGVVRPILAWSKTFVEIDCEIHVYSTVILLFPLIKDGLMSVTGESMCTRYWLTA